jgi:predicted esterase
MKSATLSIVRAIAFVAMVFACSPSHASDRVSEQIVIGKVPVIVSRPEVADAHTRLVLLYHGFGPPASPRQLADALPLADANVVAAYVNLPLVAGRLPPGGVDELMRIQGSDFVNGLFYRSIAGAVDEMPALVHALAERYHVDVDQGIGLFGFSAGGSAVLLALMDSQLPISAAVVMNAPFSVRQNVKTWERAFNKTYQWNEEAVRAADHFDVAAHADRIAARKPRPALLVLQSASDEQLDADAAAKASAALDAAYKATAAGAPVEFRALDKRKHNFGPGDTQIDDEVSSWFRAHLTH